MRETLHQLGLTLALPVAVIAVWVVRGEPGGTVPRQVATAYRVALAELPLPTRERLRAPGGAIEPRAPRIAPEDSSPRHRRPVLSNPSAPPPMALAVDADSETVVSTPPSPRPEPEPPASVPQAPLPGLPGAPALFAAAPAANTSNRPTAAPKSIAATILPEVPTTVSAAPARSTAESTAARTTAQTLSGSSGANGLAESVTPTSVAKAFGESATGGSVARALVQSSPAEFAANRTTPPPLRFGSTPAWVAGLEAEPGLSQRQTTPASSHALAWFPDHVTGLATASSRVAMGRDGNQEGRGEGFEDASGHAPLAPPGRSDDWSLDLSFESGSRLPPAWLIDLPLPENEITAAESPVDLEAKLSAPAPLFRSFALAPTTLLMIPEPGSALLVAAALAALAAARRDRRRA